MSTDWIHTFSVLREPSFMLRTLSPPQGEMNPLSLIISRSLSIPPSMLHLKVRSALDTEGRASHLSADTRRQPRSLWAVSLRLIDRSHKRVLSVTPPTRNLRGGECRPARLPPCGAVTLNTSQVEGIVCIQCRGQMPTLPHADAFFQSSIGKRVVVEK